jgi:DNA polymerase III delta prime subunit
MTENNEEHKYSWLNKYKPKSINDILGIDNQVKQIIKWLDDYDNNRNLYLSNPKKRKKINVKIIEDDEETECLDTMSEDIITTTKPAINTLATEFTANNTTNNANNLHSCMIVLGDHGVGKTSSIMTILTSKNYNIHLINLNRINLIDNINDYIEKILKGKHIIDNIFTNNKKTIIVIDEVESVVSQIEKNFIFTILKINEKKWYNPVIFISNNKHNKVITTLKSNSLYIYIYQPKYEHLRTLLLSICYKEHIYLEDDRVAQKIINYAQKDYRRLIFILQDLKMNYQTNISNIIIDEYCILSKKKDTDIDIYKATATMLVNYQNIDECIRLYESEKVIIPLMIHQNYIKCINLFNKKHHQNFSLCNDIAMSIATGDLIENYIYSDQNWDMQEVHGFFTCVFPSFKFYNEHMNITEGNIKENINFPYDLNRTSIKKINKKNIINSTECLKNFEINDFIYANKLIKNLISDDKVELCASLFNDYGATMANIESILKIDKINETKITLQTNIKKKFTQILKKKN